MSRREIRVNVFFFSFFLEAFVREKDGRIIGQHLRSFDRGKVIYDPWHYVPVLARKPGALRNGAPFKDWILPARMLSAAG